MISWKSKLQPLVATSTHEAELIALAFGADEMMWIRKTVDELWFAYRTMLLSPAEMELDHVAQRGLVLAALDVERAPMATSERSEVAFVMTNNLVDDDDSKLTAVLQQESARPTWHDSYKYITRFLPTTIFTDNEGVKHTVTNPATNAQRHRHLDLRMFKVREYVKNKCARVVHIDTTQNCADMFTKPLQAVQFKRSDIDDAQSLQFEQSSQA